MGVRLFYVDDSGAEVTGFVLYGWVEVDVTAWSRVLHGWLDFRHDLAARHQIPAAFELHATEFVGGRGQPSLDPAWNRSKAARAAVAEESLAFLGAGPALSVGSTYRRTDARGREYRAQRIAVYERLVALLDERLNADGDLGIVIMDGDGRDPSYASVHRRLKLAHRSIIEDPVFAHSTASQWVQMADLVAWTTYQHLLRREGKEFAWPWYQKYLSDSDVLGAPRQV